MYITKLKEKYPIQRWLTVDILKAVLLILMIVGHSLIWWFFEQDTFLAHPNFFVTKWVIPYIKVNSYLMLLFPMLAGVSLAFQIENKNYSTLIKRGLFVIALGTLISFRSWDVLQLIGVGIIFISTVSKKTNLEFLILTFTTVVVSLSSSFLFHNFGSKPVYWKAALFGAETGKYFFPIFPWLSTMTFGYLFERFRQKTQATHLFWRISLILGCLGVFIGAITQSLEIPVNVNNIWGPEIFSPPTSRVISHFAVFLILITVTDHLVRHKHLPFLSKSKFVSLLSKHILYIYTLHYLFGEHFIDQLKHRTSDSSWLILAVIIQLAAAYVIARGLDVLRYKTILRARWPWL